MIIKLYKNCILTDAYSEVFDVYHKDANNQTALNRYLSTLEQKTIEIPHTYVTNSGKISFDLIDENDTECYDFNYMSFIDMTNNFRRYCFIDAITVVNGIAVVSYIEDVWSNYAPSLQMRKSLLTRSRIIDYGSYKIPFYSLGMEYQGNNELKINRLFESSDNQVAVLMQVQLYKLSEKGEVSERSIMEMYGSTKTASQAEHRVYFTPQEAISLATLLTVQSSVKQLSTGQYYEIYNVILVPKIFNLSFNTSGIASVEVDNNTYLTPFLPSIDTNNDIVYTNSKTLPCNFKQFKVGTLLNAYDIIQNGTDIVIKVGYSASLTDLNLYLNFQNQIYEITKDFMLDLPISVQTADVTQQQATAREVANLNAKLGIARGAMQIAGGVADVALGATQVNISSSWGKQLKGAGQIASGLTDIGGGIMNIVSQKKQLDVANRALYVTNRGVKVLSNTALIALYGIVVYEIQPDNEVEVQANIDNCGYVCNEIVDNLFSTITTGTTNKWNVMQFDYVNIYGKFTQRIADVLRDILNAGFKIWYDETAINE